MSYYKLPFILIVLFSFLFSCKESSKNQNSKDEKKKEIKVNYPIAKDTFDINFLDSIYKSEINLKIEKRNTKYYFSHGYIGDVNEMKFDSLGVKLWNDSVYNPTHIAQFAMRCLVNYRETGEESSKELFMNQIDWVKNNFRDFGDFGFWYFENGKREYFLKSGWSSAFTQGLMISICLGAYEETNDETFLLLIEKALKGYMVPIEDGGFMRAWGDNEFWFEEYPTERPSRVLNGIIYGLVGVYQLYEATNCELALEIFMKGVTTIYNHLQDYNASYTSRYSLADWKNEIAKEDYHEGHVIQLLWLYQITKKEDFKKYAQIFLENDRADFKRRTPEYKLKNKIKEVTALHCIDCSKKGPSHLTNEKWAHGINDYWSSHRDSELILDFGKPVKDIQAITLYHVTQRSSNVKFDLLFFDEKSKEWYLVQRFDPLDIKDSFSAYHKTGKYKTFIKHFKIFEETNARKIKLIFHTDKENVIALRELDIVYDRSEDIEYLLSQMEKKLN